MQLVDHARIDVIGRVHGALHGRNLGIVLADAHLGRLVAQQAQLHAQALQALPFGHEHLGGLHGQRGAPQLAQHLRKRLEEARALGMNAQREVVLALLRLHEVTTVADEVAGIRRDEHLAAAARERAQVALHHLTLDEKGVETVVGEKGADVLNVGVHGLPNW